jgi:iron(III) transport system substrate-binding protein
VKVELLRAPGGQLFTRIQSEAAAGKLAADVIDHSDRAQAMSITDLFAPYSPPNAEDFLPATRSGDRLWPRTGNAWGIGWNTQLVKNPPKSWWDMTTAENAKLKIGQTVVVSGGGPWTRAMFERKVLGEEYWPKQAATKPLLFPSQAPMADAMIRGEVAMAPIVSTLIVPLVQQGAPLAWRFAPEGIPLTVFAAGIPKTAPHPNAAKLFLDWSLSLEGQKISVELGSYSGLKNPPAPPGVEGADAKIWLPDDAEYSKLRGPWTEDWNRLYGYRQ